MLKQEEKSLIFTGINVNSALIVIKKWNDNGKVCKMTVEKHGKTCKMAAKKCGKTCKMMSKKYGKVCKKLILGWFYAILYLRVKKGW